MATVFFNQIPIDMTDPIDWLDFFNATASSTHSSTSWSATNSATGGLWQFTGTQFGGYQGNVPFSGTITGITYSINGVTVFSVSGASMNVNTFLTQGFLGDYATAVAGLYPGSETVNGTIGDDYLEGFAGNDTLDGAGGNDVVGGGDGTDTLRGGAGVDFLFGDGGADTLLGGADADYLEGGAGPGTNSMSGEGGDDAIFTLVAGDTISGGDGVDLLVLDRAASTVSFNLDSTTMAGSVTLADGTTISSMEWFDITTGVGNDTFKLVGAPVDITNFDAGDGTDRLILDLSGTSDGFSMIFATTTRGTITSSAWSITFNLTDVFEITAGNGNDQFGGGRWNDILSGGGGNDIIEGGDGDDTLAGGDGNDVLMAGGDHGDDALSGGAGDDRLYGYDGDNTLLGGDGDDQIYSSSQDLVDGGAGNDLLGLDLSALTSDLVFSTAAMSSNAGATLANGTTVKSMESFYITSGSGNDTFLVSGPLVQIQSYSVAFDGGQGVDRFVGDFSALSSAVRANNGMLTIEGVTGFAYTEIFEITGGSGNDEFVGNSGDDIFVGGAGADSFEGGAGHNTLAGGAGTDRFTSLYGVDDIDGGADDDFVELNFALYSNGVTINMDGAATNDGATLSNGTTIRNVETFEIRGGDGFDRLFVDDYLVGEGNRFLGMGGSDWLTADLSGAAAAVSFDGRYLTTSTGKLEVQAEILEITGGSGNDVFLGATNSNNTFEGGAGDDILSGAEKADHLRGGDGADTLEGSDGDDDLHGGVGADVLQGGLGADLAGYGTSAAGVIINLGTGAISGGDADGDTFNSIEGVIGSSFDDALTGDAGANVLVGGAGADALRGGAGDDVYYIDNAGDVVTEGSASGGIDRVHSSISYTLRNNVENLVLMGTAAINAVGNTLNNTLTGNSGANTLDGKEGADTMSGGAGNDIYGVNSSGDVVSETADGGVDQINAYVTTTLGANIEKLSLRGTAKLNGTGNELDNALGGNGNDNVLDGKAGADTMAGAGGDDTYGVDNAGDVVKESAGGGYDRINSYVSLTLAANVEMLQLRGSANLNGAGNGLDNTILGNSGANILKGGLGLDFLTGGAGDDLFKFDTALSAGNVDAITDFNVANDGLQLENNVFTALTTTGVLNADAFHTGAAAHDASDRVVYDATTGALYYDADGAGAGAAIQFAQLSAGLGLTSADIFVV